MVELRKRLDWLARKLKGDVELPYLVFFVVFVNLFFYSMIQTMVFSFLPKLVKSFNVAEVEVGRYHVSLFYAYEALQIYQEIFLA